MNLPTIPFPFIPLTVGPGENHRQTELETTTQQGQLPPLKITQLYQRIL